MQARTCPNCKQNIHSAAEEEKIWICPNCETEVKKND